MTGEWTANSSDDDHTHIPTKSLMTSLFEQNKISSQFALAISRPGEKGTSYGGLLTIGGIPLLKSPKVNATDDFASAAFETYDSAEFNESTHGLPLLADYTISVDGLYYGTVGNMSVNSKPAQYYLDCGDPNLHIPMKDLEQWLAMFDPPLQSANAEFNCSSTMPDFKFRIGGKLFPINPDDLAYRTADGRCKQRLQAFDGPPYILGDLFHRNVVAVYDWEKLEMRFASRPYYRN